MTNLPVFEDEAERLAALLKTRLLDTPVENRFERVTRLVQNMLNVPIVVFNLIGEDRQWAKSIQGLNDVEVPREDSFCSHTIQGDRVLIVTDARTDPRFAKNPSVMSDPNIVFYAGCPVHSPEGQRIGALCVVDRKPRTLVPREVQMLRDMAGVLESEIRMDSLRDQIEGLETNLTAAEGNSRIDELTRLPNRSGILDIYRREWMTALRNKTPIAVVTADVDGLKSINNAHGRETGEEVLRQLSRILMSSLRYEDAIGRIEGGEFMMVLPGCPQERLFEIVERIRLETLSGEIDTSKGPLPVTVSFGIAGIIPDENIEMTELMEQAEIALMSAKKQGRNKTVVYKPDMPKVA